MNSHEVLSTRSFTQNGVKLDLAAAPSVKDVNEPVSFGTKPMADGNANVVRKVWVVDVPSINLSQN